MKSENVLLVAMVSSVVGGISLGIGLRTADLHLSPKELSYFNFPGETFLRMLRMLILPLIVSSLVTSLAQLQMKTAGRLGYVTGIYFLLTTFLAVIQGIIFVLIIQPGTRGGKTFHEHVKQSDCENNAVDTILDLIRNLFPDNLVQACFSSVRTCIVTRNITEDNGVIAVANGSNASVESKLMEEVITAEYPGINILGLVMMAIAFGAVISMLGEEGRPLGDLFACLEKIAMKLVSAVIWYGPVGILFLIASQILAMDDPVEDIKGVGFYLITVITSLFVHGFIVLPLIYFCVVRKNPLVFIKGVAQALVTGLSTDSSSATLPVTVRCLEDNLGIDHRISRFVCPLGATINMNGSALYEAIAAIYIAQVLGRTLSIGQIILVSLTATLAAVGAAGIPSAGLVTLLMVLAAVDLPPEYAALIIPVDWFLDRLRTVVNIFGDTVGAGIVQRFCADDLPKELPHPHAHDVVKSVVIGNRNKVLPTTCQSVNHPVVCAIPNGKLHTDGGEARTNF